MLQYWVTEGAMHDKRQGAAGRGVGADTPSPGPDIGKRTLVEQLPILRKAGPAVGGPVAGDTGFSAKTAEARGGAPLPTEMRTAAEASTNTDLSGVRVHTNDASAAAADAVSARAFTQGSNIYFGAGEYRPGTAEGDHLLAHEVAHTVQQQRGTGVQAKGQVSQPGDAAELEADRAADSIVRAEPTTISERAPAIARRPKREASKRPAAVKTVDTAVEKTGSLSNSYGTFTFKITKDARASGCVIDLSFKAFSPEVDASKITIIQTIKNHQAAGAIFYLNNDSTYYSPFDTGDGTYTDHLPGETDPFYNFEEKTNSDESTGSTGATATDMNDAPHINSLAGERGADFETAPFALAGKDKGEFYGTFTWGYAIDGAGKFLLKDVAVHDDITTNYGAALRKFIAREASITATKSTPAPASVEMPLSKRRELTAAEKTAIKPFADFLKANAKARVWATSRYDARGHGVDPNHAMAMDNAKGIQKALTDLGAPEGQIRIVALEESATPKLDVNVIDLAVINS